MVPTSRWLRRLVWTAGIIAAVAGPLWLGSSPDLGAQPAGDRLASFESSPNWRDGRFVDVLPRREPFVLAQLLDRVRATDSTPRAPLPIERRRRRDFIGPPRGGLRVTWLGHASVIVEIEGYRILLDPVWRRRASPLPFGGPTRFHAAPLPLEELPRLDAVVISHDHHDHLDRTAIVATASSVPRFIAPLGVGAHLEHWGVPASHVTELDWWRGTDLGHLRLTATPARHTSGRSPLGADRDITQWAGWVIAGRERRVFFSGDTGMFPGLQTIGERFGPFDVTLLPIGGYAATRPDEQLGPEQAVEAHLHVRGQLLLPVHWATFALSSHAWTEPIERVLVAARRAGVAIVAPVPGQGVEPSAPPQLDQWWPEVPWRRAEDDPVVSSGLDGGR